MLIFPAFGRYSSVAAFGGGGGGGAVAGFVGAQVYKASDQIGAGYTSRSAIAWDSEHFDTHAFHDSGANTRLTIPSALNGYYVVVLASVTLQNVSGVSTADLCIAKGGSITFDGTSGYKNATGGGVDGVANQVFLQCRTQPIQVSTGDYFEAMLFNDADAAMDIIAAQSSFGIYVVGASVMGCLVKNTSDLTAQNFNNTSPTWAAEVYDTDAFHDPGSNPSRITIPSAANGRYGILKANVRLSSVSNNINLAVSIEKSNVALGAWLEVGAQLSRTDGSSLGNGWCECETQPLLLATGDYFETNIFCSDTSTTLDANGSSFSLEVLPVGFQGALCKISADVTAHNYSTPEDLTWNGTDVYDTTGADQHDPASNNTKIIITSGLNGKYAILHSNIYTSLVANLSAHSVVIQKGNTNSYAGFGGRGGSNGSFANSWLSGRTQIVQLVTADEFTAQFYMSDTSVTLEAESTTFGLRVLPEL